MNVFCHFCHYEVGNTDGKTAKFPRCLDLVEKKAGDGRDESYRTSVHLEIVRCLGMEKGCQSEREKSLRKRTKGVKETEREREKRQNMAWSPC